MAIEFYFYAGKTFTKKSRAKAIVYWEKPEVNWFKLNIDRSSIGNLGKAGEGGLIRDHKGNWISRFAHGIGKPQALMPSYGHFETNSIDVWS